MKEFLLVIIVIFTLCMMGCNGANEQKNEVGLDKNQKNEVVDDDMENHIVFKPDLKDVEANLILNEKMKDITNKGAVNMKQYHSPYSNTDFFLALNGEKKITTVIVEAKSKNEDRKKMLEDVNFVAHLLSSEMNGDLDESIFTKDKPVLMLDFYIEYMEGDTTMIAVLPKEAKDR